MDAVDGDAADRRGGTGDQPEKAIAVSAVSGGTGVTVSHGDTEETEAAGQARLAQRNNFLRFQRIPLFVPSSVAEYGKADQYRKTRKAWKNKKSN